MQLFTQNIHFIQKNTQCSFIGEPMPLKSDGLRGLDIGRGIIDKEGLLGTDAKLLSSIVEDVPMGFHHIYNIGNNGTVHQGKRRTMGT